MSAKKIFSLLHSVPAKFKKSIRYKLSIIYIIIILIPVLVYGIVTYNLSANTVESDFIKYKQDINTQIAKSIDDNFFGLQKQVFSIFTLTDDVNYILNFNIKNIDDAYFEAKNRLTNLFSFLLQSNVNMSGLALISMDGEIKYTINDKNRTTTLKSVKDKQWFADALALKGNPLFLQAHASDFVFYRQGESVSTVVSIVQEIISPSSGQPIGVLVLDQDTDEFFGYSSSSYLSKTDLLAVFDHSGSPIFYNRRFDSEMEKTFKQVYNLKAQKAIKLNVERSEYLFISSPPSQFGFRIIYALPTSELLQKSVFLKNITFSVLIIILVFILAISVFVSNIITMPLHRLMTSFKTLETGDFSVTVPVKGNDEIARIGITFNNMVRNIKTLIGEKYEANLLRKQAELESLQSQINPHFLYNTLTSIKAVIDTDEKKTASTMIQNLSDIFRYSLSRGKHMVKFTEELEHSKKYLGIMEERYGGNYKVHYDIDDSVLECKIPRLTLQPILENAFYHGLEGRKGNGEIRITAKIDNDKYNIYVYDNGNGIPPDSLDKINEALAQNPELEKGNPEKIGIFNVNSRIKFLFGPEYGLRISSTYGSNTTVKIVLPAGNKE